MGLTFDGKYVTSGPRERAEASRHAVRAMLQRALWEAFATSPECAEGEVRGQIFLDGPQIALAVGDCTVSLRYDAERDLVDVPARDGFAVTCVEFAWLVRAMVEWIDDQSPAGS